MNDIPLYNSRLIKSYVEYVNKKYPDIDMHPILEHSGIPSYQLNDEGHWLTQKQIDQFHANLTNVLEKPNISREVGRNAPFLKAAGAISQFVMGLVEPSAVYNLMGKIYPRLSRACDITTRKIDSRSIEIVVKPINGVEEKPYQCENRLGIFEAVSKLFTNQYAQIDHPTCLHDGGDCCRYIVNVKKTGSFFWKKIKTISLLASLATLLGLGFVLPANLWLVAALICVVISLSISLISAHRESLELRQTLKNEGKLANNLLDQVNISYNNALIIQEIGQATSSILDIQKLLKYTMETFQKRLDFDRGMIMLANKERTRLLYTVGYGYSEVFEKILQRTQFHLDKPGTQGQLVRSFKEQQPFLVSDVKSIEKDLSERSLHFLKTMNTHSFICVPIVYKGRSEGILAVDNVRSKRPLSQSDLSLLMGIAPQIGISINNARAYQMIRQREESFRALSENAPDIIFTVDTAGTFTYANPAWEKILGHSQAKVIGKNSTEFIRKQDKKAFMKLFLRSRNRKETIKNYHGIFLHKNGSERLFNMNSAPNLDSDGNVIGLVGIFKDITEQHKLENELRVSQKMQAIGTLSAGIAHDFNNILTPIIGFAEMLKYEMDKDSKNHWMIERIFHASLRAKELVQQILTFSRQTEQEQKPLQIGLIIKETLGLMRASLPSTIEIRHHVNSESLILGDPTQIHQVVMNLCANAGYAMESQDSGVLEVRVAEVEIDDRFAARHTNITPGQYIRLTVNDTGYGMTTDIMERIFDPFFSTKERTKGIGMGLSVVHGIVENHKGFITVYSKPDIGSSFNVYFPIVQEIQEATRNSFSESRPVSGGYERILLIDDELPVIEYGKEVLETLGYKVTSKTDSLEALALFREKYKEFDLVITDMTMPKMTGDRLAKKIRDIRPGMPIIICTGFSPYLPKEEAEGIGVAAFVSKPMLQWEIATAIRKVLNH